MSTSSPRQLTKLAFILAALCLLQGLPLTGAMTPEDYVVQALQLLRSLFPGLKDADVLIKYRSPLYERDPLYKRNSFEISLYRPLNPTGFGDLSPRSEYLFDVHFQFNSKDHQLQDLMLWGPFISAVWTGWRKR
jgi:hypothetical protein